MRNRAIFWSLHGSLLWSGVAISRKFCFPHGLSMIAYHHLSRSEKRLACSVTRMVPFIVCLEGQFDAHTSHTWLHISCSYLVARIVYVNWTGTWPHRSCTHLVTRRVEVSLTDIWPHMMMMRCVLACVPVVICWSISLHPCGKQHFRDLPTPDWASPLTKITYYSACMTRR